MTMSNERSSRGRSTEESHAVLAEDIEECLAGHPPPSKLSVVVPASLGLNLLLFSFSTFIAILILVGAVDEENQLDLPAAGVSVGILLLILRNFFLCSLRQFRLKNAARKRIRLFLKELAMLNISDDIYMKEATEATVTTIRDGEERQIPILLLARGDCVVLDKGRRAPCSLITFEGNDISEGENLSDISSASSHLISRNIKMICKETPAIQVISSLLENEKKCPSPEDRCSLLSNRYATLLALFFSLSISASSLRFYLAAEDDIMGTRYIFAVPALCVLPLLLISVPIIYSFVIILNNTSTSLFLSDEDDRMSVGREDSRPVFPWLLLAWRKSQEFWESPDVVSLLGGVTGVCVVDKQGLLSPHSPALEKIFFFRRSEDGDELIGESLEVSSQLVDPGEASSLHINDPNWHRFYSNLAAAVCAASHTTRCALTGRAEGLDSLSSSLPSLLPSTHCLCSLQSLLQKNQTGRDGENSGPFFGIAVPSNCESSRASALHPLDDSQVETAVCVESSVDDSIHSSLFCSGSGRLLLPLCEAFWDGKQLCEFTQKAARAAADFAQRHSFTGFCTALTYRPLCGSSCDFLDGGVFDVVREMTGDPGWGGVLRSQSVLSLPSQQEGLDFLLKSHVFLALVALQYQAFPRAVFLSEELQGECVRFVFFSRENQLRSRVFAEKLGLEAGWNCHISLAALKKEGFLNRWETNRRLATKSCEELRMLEQSSCESLNRRVPELPPNKAKLPCGIQHVRPHLQEVDNVPLLVSLFTDCTAEDISQMVEIMHENGEEELILGLALSAVNWRVFMSSSAGLAVRCRSSPSCSLESPATPSSSSASLSELAIQIATLHSLAVINQTQLTSISPLLSFCRRKMGMLSASLSFLVLFSFTLSLFCIACLLCFLPFPFLSTHLLAWSSLLTPCLAISIAAGDDGVVRYAKPSAPSQPALLPLLSSSVSLSAFIFTFFPNVFFILSVFYILLAEHSHVVCLSPFLCSLGSSRHLSIHQIQHVIGFVTTWCLLLCSSLSVFPFDALWLRPPVRNLGWLAMAVGSVVFQLSLSHWQLGQSLLSLIPSPLFPLLLSWSPLLLLLGHLHKRRLRDNFSRDQRRRKFGFDTKLGMNSPY